jgi:hypothetical protein
MQIRSIGIDLGKTTFHLVALGDGSNPAPVNGLQRPRDLSGQARAYLIMARRSSPPNLHHS